MDINKSIEFSIMFSNLKESKDLFTFQLWAEKLARMDKRLLVISIRNSEEVLDLIKSDPQKKEILKVILGGSNV